MTSYDISWNFNRTSTTTTPYSVLTNATHDPRLREKIFGDFTAFYVTITICTILGAFLFLLNIALCCCSRYKKYWQDSNTGKYSIAYIRFYDKRTKYSSKNGLVELALLWLRLWTFPSYTIFFFFVFVLCRRILRFVNFVSPAFNGDMTEILSFPTYISHYATKVKTDISVCSSSPVYHETHGFKCEMQRLLLLSVKFKHESNATLGRNTVICRTVDIFV